LPFDENFVTYVWFDALINYVTALDYPAGKRFKKFWPHAQHLIAKDILKPHGIYWPTMLKAAGLAPYRYLNVHGYWGEEASKMSKSLGNVVNPLDLVDKYGLDPFRYFLMREMVFGLDASFSELALVQRLNSDLANDLGNLLQRSLTMTHRYLQGSIPPPGAPEALDLELQEKAGQILRDYPEKMRGLQFHQALMLVWELIGQTNRYIDFTEPFRVAKDPDQRERLGTILYHILEVNRLLAVLLWPVMPETSQRISEQLGVQPPGECGDFDRLGQWGGLQSGGTVRKAEPLFPRVDLEAVGLKDTASNELLGESASRPDEITIDEFQKMDLRVGKVLAAERLKGSDRLLKLRVDIGGGEIQVVAGLADSYSPEALMNRLIIVVVNLKPTKIFGQISQGMLLAATHESNPRLLTVDEPISPGARIH
jgi:methionyl-tRNA synthetase